MRILGWEKDYETGISKFDENNKIIIVLLNQLLKLFYQEKMDPEFHRLYATILMYANKEFALEEKIMNKLKFEAAQLHISQHHEFINKLEYFSNQYLMGEKSAFEFQRYAVKWTETHIQVTDKKMVAWIKENFLNSIIIDEIG